MIFRRILYYIIPCLLFILFCTACCSSPFQLKTAEMTLPGWDPAHRDVTFLVISDLHLRPEILDRRFYRVLERRVKELDPDIVFLLGDLLDFNSKGKIAPVKEKMLSILSNLRGRYGSYAVIGNHEVYCGEDMSVELFQEAGYTVLQDELQTVEINGRPLSFIGVQEGYRQNKYLPARLKELLKKNPVPLILCHRPDLFDGFPLETPFIFLSGHTHGGLFSFPFLRSGVFHFKGRPVYRKYPYGIFRSGKGKLLVTSGLGDSNYYSRFNIPYEVVLLKIRPE